MKWQVDEITGWQNGMADWQNDLAPMINNILLNGYDEVRGKWEKLLAWRLDYCPNNKKLKFLNFIKII